MMNTTTGTQLAKKESTVGAIAVCKEKTHCQLKLSNGIIRPMTWIERFQHEWKDKFGRCMFMVVLMLLVIPAFAKDKWQVGYFRTMQTKNAEQINSAAANGYHITIGTHEYTCVGGDDHNAPECGSDKTWAQTAMSGRAIGFADGTAYACELGSCPEWVDKIEVIRMRLDGAFQYRIDKKGQMEIKGELSNDKFPAPTLDGKKHDLRVISGR